MTKPWPTVRLGEVLTRSAETVTIAPEKEYREITVRLWGKGVVLRRIVSGAEIAGDRRFVAKAGQFILSRIDSRNGAMGIVPVELDGAVVTNDFPLFDLNRNKLDAAYLSWLSKTSGFVELCKRASEGTTNRVRLQENRFLSLEITLPPLMEQRRIVTRIEALAAKIEEAKTVRAGIADEVTAMLAAEERKIWPQEMLRQAKPMEEVTTLLARGRQSEQGESDHWLIKSQHVQMGRYIPTALTLAPYVACKVPSESLLQNKDVLIACSAAGCLGRVAFYAGNEKKVSTDTHVAIARANQAVIAPEYLYAYLRGAQGQVQLRSREKGDWTREKIGFRLIELNVADMRRVPIPVPPLREQLRIVAYLDRLQTKVDALRRLQSETDTELAALVPSIFDLAFRGKL